MKLYLFVFLILLISISCEAANKANIQTTKKANKTNKKPIQDNIFSNELINKIQEHSISEDYNNQNLNNNTVDINIDSNNTDDTNDLLQTLRPQIEQLIKKSITERKHHTDKDYFINVQVQNKSNPTLAPIDTIANIQQHTESHVAPTVGIEQHTESRTNTLANNASENTHINTNTNNLNKQPTIQPSLQRDISYINHQPFFNPQMTPKLVNMNMKKSNPYINNMNSNMYPKNLLVQNNLIKMTQFPKMNQINNSKFGITPTNTLHKHIVENSAINPQLHINNSMPISHMHANGNIITPNIQPLGQMINSAAAASSIVVNNPIVNTTVVGNPPVVNPAVNPIINPLNMSNLPNTNIPINKINDISNFSNTNTNTLTMPDTNSIQNPYISNTNIYNPNPNYTNIPFPSQNPNSMNTNIIDPTTINNLGFVNPKIVNTIAVDNLDNVNNSNLSSNFGNTGSLLNHEIGNYNEEPVMYDPYGTHNIPREFDQQLKMITNNNLKRPIMMDSAPINPINDMDKYHSNGDLNNGIYKEGDNRRNSMRNKGSNNLNSNNNNSSDFTKINDSSHEEDYSTKSNRKRLLRGRNSNNSSNTHNNKNSNTINSNTNPTNWFKSLLLSSKLPKINRNKFKYLTESQHKARLSNQYQEYINKNEDNIKSLEEGRTRRTASNKPSALDFAFHIPGVENENNKDTENNEFEVIYNKQTNHNSKTSSPSNLSLVNYNDSLSSSAFLAHIIEYLGSSNSLKSNFNKYKSCRYNILRGVKEIIMKNKNVDLYLQNSRNSNMKNFNISLSKINKKYKLNKLVLSKNIFMEILQTLTLCENNNSSMELMAQLLINKLSEEKKFKISPFMKELSEKLNNLTNKVTNNPLFFANSAYKKLIGNALLLKSNKSLIISIAKVLGGVMREYKNSIQKKVKKFLSIKN